MGYGQFYPVSAHKAHEHEYDYVSSLGSQEAHPVSLADNHKDLMSVLRKEYYTQNEQTDQSNFSFRTLYSPQKNRVML